MSDGDGAANALRQMSDTLTEQTDVVVGGADLVVTRGSVVEGNRVTVVLHDAEADDEETIVGFQDEAVFEDVLSKLVSASRAPLVELSDREVEAVDYLVRAAGWELPGDLEEAVHDLLRRLPEVDPDD